MSELDNIKEYYADLLILQYRGKSKARATVKLGAEIYAADGLLFQLNNILDIDTAVGKQLDIIGKILDCPRSIQGLTVDKKYFSFEEATAPLGFSTRSELSEGLFKTRYNSTLSIYSLTDEEYRNLLKFKAVYNVKRGSMADLDNIYYSLFGTNIKIVNNHNLSITYRVSSSLTVPLSAAIHLGYITPPLGIDYNYIYV